MTAPSFSDLLDSIGWSNKELAERLNRHEQTIARWRKEGAPDYVIAYLKQVDRLVGKPRENTND